MATEPENQQKVMQLSADRFWRPIAPEPSQTGETGSCSEGVEETKGKEKNTGVKVVACFGMYPGRDSLYHISSSRAGYHPWFTHRYTLSSSPITKEAHYTSLFFKPGSSSTSKNRLLVTSLLPYLPDPIPFVPLVDQLRADIQAAQDRGGLVMVGEIGLDGGARVRWPVGARHLYTEKYGASLGEEEKLDDQGEWKRLTPFKVNMEHQKEVMRRQLEVAVELGVNVSVHCVAAAGE